MSSLRAAHAALVAGDDGDALAHLLDAWRATPAIVLADAIELVGARAARAVHPPAGVTAEDRDAAWFAAAAAGDPVMRHRLVETVTDVLDDLAKVHRLQTLARVRDPRIAMKLVAFVAEPHASLVHHVPTYWRPLFAMLEACGDPRVRAAVAGLSWSARLRREPASRRAAFASRIAKVNARLAVAFPAPPPELDDDDLALARDLIRRAHVPPPTAARAAAIEAGLLAAIYAAPAEDGPRAIYADWLQERGDPRGELIALQLSDDPSLPRWERTPARVRIDELLAQHRDRWLGPLAPCLVRSVFERGFVAVAQLTDRVVPHPSWATVRDVVGGIPATDASPMPILTVARDLDSAALVHLASLASPPPLQSLGWRSAGDDWSAANGYREATRTAIVAFGRVLPRLSTLRRLQLAGGPGWVVDAMRPGQLGWPWQAPGSTIRELQLTASVSQLGAWIDQALAADLDVLELVDTQTNWRVTLADTRLAVSCGYDRSVFQASFDALAVGLERLPADHLTDLKLDVPAKDLWNVPNRRRMAAILDRQPRATPAIRGFTRPLR
ncbi:MAG: TIGR02996 domain-containing protein [Proteobacteria bacterium]|nr:TIGR02996 domain-containing protein [Pseudomonadota bacterium]